MTTMTPDIPDRSLLEMYQRINALSAPQPLRDARRLMVANVERTLA